MHFSTTSEEVAMFPSTCWHYPVVSDKEFTALLCSVKEMYCVSLFEFKGVSSAVEKRLSVTLNILSKCQGRLKKVLKAIACVFQHIQLSKSASPFYPPCYCFSSARWWMKSVLGNVRHFLWWCCPVGLELPMEQSLREEGTVLPARDGEASQSVWKQVVM